MSKIRFSPSSQSTFQTCPRRWWFSKVKKLPEPSNATLRFGIAVHYVLENYLRDGTLVEPGTYQDGRDLIVVTKEHVKRASESFVSLPAPGDYEVENWINGVEIGPFRVAGKIDAYKLVDGHLYIIDHKTRSNFKWALTEEQLHVDGQGNFYAEALRRSPDIGEFDRVTFSHNNVASRGGIAHRYVTSELDFGIMSELWERSEERAVTMGEFIPVENQDDVPANTNNCRKYNTLCPFAEHCSAHLNKSSPKALFAAVASLGSRNNQPTQNGGPMGILDRTRAAAAASKNPQTTAPEAPKAAPDPKPDNATQITSTESAAYDPAMVSSTVLREVFDILQGMRKTGVPMLWPVVTNVAKKEGIPEDHWPCLAAALDLSDLPEEFEPLLEADEAMLLSGATAAEIMGTADAATPDGSHPLAATLSALPDAAFEAAISGLSPEDLQAVQDSAEEFSESHQIILAGVGSDDSDWATACKDENPDYVKVCEWILANKKQDGNLDLVNSSMVDSGVFKRTRTPSARKIMKLLVQHPDIREGSNGNYHYVGEFAPEVPKGDEVAEIQLSDITEVSGAEAIQRALSLIEVCEDVEILRGTLRLVTESSRRAKAARKRLRDLGEDCPEPQPAAPEKPVDRDYTASKAPVVEGPPAEPPNAAPARPPSEGQEPPNAPTMVFLGCLPMGMAFGDFSSIDMVAEAVEEVNNRTMAEKDLPWTLYNNYGDSGPKRVVNTITQKLSKGYRLPPGAWFLDKNNPLVGADVLGVLQASGVVVVRPVF